jgi:hypothetical protein
MKYFCGTEYAPSLQVLKLGWNKLGSSNIHAIGHFIRTILQRLKNTGQSHQTHYYKHLICVDETFVAGLENTKLCLILMLQNFVHYVACHTGATCKSQSMQFNNQRNKEKAIKYAEKCIVAVLKKCLDKKMIWFTH